MLDDVQAIADFYATQRGQVVSRLLRRHLQSIWPDLSRQTLVGLGYTRPYLSLWRHQALHCIDAVTGGGDPVGADCLVRDDALPFPDFSIERVLMAHALENAAQASGMLRAARRLLRDDGRLLIVMPNRSGLWAHSETTPFADGAPCSTGRIERLLARSRFRVERMQGALYCPPANLRPLLRFGASLERAGRFVTPKLAGVLIVEATKDLHAAVPVSVATAPVRRMLLPLGTVPASRSGAPAR